MGRPREGRPSQFLMQAGLTYNIQYEQRFDFKPKDKP